MHFRLGLVLAIIFLMSSCEEVPYSPKPRGFPKVEYPVRSYQEFTAAYCDFTFDYPTYASIEQDTSFFDEKPLHPCWFDIVMPVFNARIHCSYIPINAENSFDQLRSDAFEMANKHNLKADYIDENALQNPNGVGAVVFNIKGAAASPFQFYLTDTTSHFMRGALYFNTQARPDSLAPVSDFVKQDIMKVIETFDWD